MDGHVIGDMHVVVDASAQRSVKPHMLPSHVHVLPTPIADSSTLNAIVPMVQVTPISNYSSKDKGCKPRAPTIFTGDDSVEIGPWLAHSALYLSLTQTPKDNWVATSYSFLGGSAFTLWTAHPANSPECS